MNVLRRLIALSLTLVVVLLSTSTAGAATPTVDGYVGGYAYDVSHHPAPPEHTASERGPPALHNYTTPAYDAVGPRSHGVSTRLNGRTTLSIVTYAYPGRFARGAGATATTRRDGVPVDGDLSLFQQSDVAAKSAPTVNVTERIAPNPVKPTEALDRWDHFLGPGPHTNIHPRTGVADPNRIVSSDGLRSIRFGSQEMNSSPTKFHYHEETWSFDPVANAWNVENLLVRVPFPKGSW